MSANGYKYRLPVAIHTAGDVNTVTASTMKDNGMKDLNMATERVFGVVVRNTRVDGRRINGRDTGYRLTRMGRYMRGDGLMI
jgi:hypothetical protein